MSINIIKNRNWWFIFSGLIVIASIVLIATLGLRFGIDFTGGSIAEVKIPQTPALADMRDVLSIAGFPDATVQTTGNNGYMIRTQDLTELEHQIVLDSMRQKFGEVEELSFDSIGPTIGKELRKLAIISVIITLLLIGLYIAWAFRKVSEPVASWKYGILTILTAFHDVLIPVGAFALFGHFFGWEAGTAFVAAVLTILGYSINDTIVVLDRTRENLIRRAGESFEETLEKSVKQTLRRSLYTSLTTLLALIAIFLFGGETTKSFAMVLIIGIITGTYSSIFLATPMLLVWERWGKK